MDTCSDAEEVIDDVEGLKVLGLLAQQFGVEHLVAEEHQRYDLYHAEEVLLPDAHTEHLYYYASASLNYIQPKGEREEVAELVGLVGA